MLSTEAESRGQVDDILLDLPNSSHLTQPHSINAIWPVDFTEKHKWKQKLGLIKIWLVYFGNAYYHMSLCPYLKG